MADILPFPSKRNQLEHSGIFRAAELIKNAVSLKNADAVNDELSTMSYMSCYVLASRVFNVAFQDKNFNPTLVMTEIDFIKEQIHFYVDALRKAHERGELALKDLNEDDEGPA